MGLDAKVDHAAVRGAITSLCLADTGGRLTMTADPGWFLMVAVDLSCVLVSSTKKRRNVGERRCFKMGGETGREFLLLRTCQR